MADRPDYRVPSPKNVVCIDVTGKQYGTKHQANGIVHDNPTALFYIGRMK
jgi:hypothetical protein